MQIISQNYVVWNLKIGTRKIGTPRLQIISQNYVVWNGPVPRFKKRNYQLQIISQNYVVWNIWNITVKIFGFIVANYITKLRGLKLKAGKFKNDSGESCKLYHKTTWFETVSMPEKSLRSLRCKLYHKTTWFETCHLWLILIAFQSVANYITKLRGLKLENFNINT